MSPHHLFVGVITLLAATMIGCASSRSGTVDASLRIGPNQLSPEEIGEVITHVAFYAGWPTAANAARIIKEVYDARQ